MVPVLFTRNFHTNVCRYVSRNANQTTEGRHEDKEEGPHNIVKLNLRDPRIWRDGRTEETWARQYLKTTIIVKHISRINYENF